MPDINGKPWAQVKETKAGSILIPDGGFTCLEESIAVVVKEDKDGLYVPCADGTHHLDGQLSDDGTEYVGLWRSPVFVNDDGDLVEPQQEAGESR